MDKVTVGQPKLVVLLDFDSLFDEVLLEVIDP